MEYSRALRYISVLIVLCASASWAETKPTAATGPLAEAVASFGAVTSDGWIYVYSGHIGTAHDHSKENLSQHFRRRPVGGGPWEELPMETPLQGLALVAHEGYVYRVGGMTAKNTLDEEEDLHSSDTFARFNPKTRRWTHLSPLPAGRSSHDAVVIDSKVYVVGGWQLTGTGDDGQWQTDVLIFDLENPDQGWKTVKQPFERRALAASHRGGKLYAIGGMNAVHDIDRSVDIFDPATGSWSNGPELPGEGMNGFGVSAWSINESLLASGSNGVVYQLSEDGEHWLEVARLNQGRFFHQLVPAENGNLLALGGASRKGHLTDIEQIQFHDK